MVVELATNPSLGREAVCGEGFNGSRTPGVAVSSIPASCSLNQLRAHFEVLVKPFVLEEKTVVAEPTRRQFALQLNVGDVLPLTYWALGKRIFLQLTAGGLLENLILGLTHYGIFSAEVGFLLGPDLKQSRVVTKLRQLLVERDHVAHAVPLTRVWPQTLDVIMGHKLQVCGKPHAGYDSTIFLGS